LPGGLIVVNSAMMSEGEYLAGRLLLAMPGMADQRFAKSVIAMCVHDENGAFGINLGERREGISFHSLLQEVDIEPGQAPDCDILHGGPVEPGRGFVLHSTDWGGTGTIEVKPFGALSASLDVLKAISDGNGPSRWVFALGYAGWAPGQLENEMRHHGWHAASGHEAVVYDTRMEARWASAWRAEGVDPSLLSNATGRA
jgi:putative transcriptional regulator